MTDADAQSPGEPFPVGKTAAAQERNAALLSGYDYKKYPAGITGYTGQDRQRIGVLRYEDAVRTRVGPRGNYKGGFTRMPDGRLLIAVCRSEPDPTEPSRSACQIYVYESSDEGLSWSEIAKPGIIAKEPSLTVLPSGAVLMTGQDARMWKKPEERGLQLARSTDGGRIWDAYLLMGGRYPYPRNVIVDRDGSLLFLRPTEDWDLLLIRSEDEGLTWTSSQGKVNWDEKDRNFFAETSVLRLDDGTLLAALRRQIPGTEGEGFEDTVITRSTDDGKTWSAPVRMVGTAEVHVYLTQLADGRLLATYSNYHLPYGVCAILSTDNGETWDRGHPMQLSLSADLYVGWPVTLQLPDGGLITSHAATTYVKEPPDRSTCEVVRWNLPKW